MPLPLFVLIGLAAGTATYGGIQTINAMDNNTQAENIEKQAKKLYDCSVRELDMQRATTNYMLEKLGRTKIETSAREMKFFVDTFRKFTNVEYISNIGNDMNLNTEMYGARFIDMEKDADTAADMLKIGAGSVAASALTAAAVYGGVGAFATAGTGAAISGLAGAAASNATLAWLGGGTLAAGGAGVAGGTVVLGGIALAPLLAIGGALLEAKSRENIENAKKKYAEAAKASEEMGMMKDTLRAIYSIADDYNDFILGFNRRFSVVLNYMYSIVIRRLVNDSSKLDYNELDEEEKNGVHLAWIMAQILQGLLKQKLLDSQGRINASAQELLNTAKVDCRQLGI